MTTAGAAPAPVAAPARARRRQAPARAPRAAPSRWPARSRPVRSTLLLALAFAVLALARGAAARPLYFDNLVGIYGLTPADDIHACGVCHRLWTGTGARNPYGSAIEAQLYLAKPIATAIADVAALDTDGDGFTNGDELGIHRTLPAYSCSNYLLAEDPPPTFQSLITALPRQ